QAGCVFFAPGFFAQAKKGGSRRHGAKALDLDVAGNRNSRRVKTRPTGLLAATQKSKGGSLRSHPHPALRATFSRKREKGCPIDIPQAGEGLVDWSPAGRKDLRDSVRRGYPGRRGLPP